MTEGPPRESPKAMIREHDLAAPAWASEEEATEAIFRRMEAVMLPYLELHSVRLIHTDRPTQQELEKLAEVYTKAARKLDPDQITRRHLYLRAMAEIQRAKICMMTLDLPVSLRPRPYSPREIAAELARHTHWATYFQTLGDALRSEGHFAQGRDATERLRTRTKEYNERQSRENKKRWGLWQKVADDIWSRNPLLTKNAVAALVQKQVGYPGKTTTIAKRIEDRRAPSQKSAHR